MAVHCCYTRRKISSAAHCYKKTFYFYGKPSRYYGKASYYTNPLCQLCNLSELIHREICRLYCKMDVYIGFIKYFSHSNVYCNKIFISVMRCRAGRYISITSR